MRRVRVIPALLLQNGGLVKSINYKNHKYIGDPINAVKIFNDKQVDELVILDITATAERRTPHIEKIKEIASEAFMPVAYGGGITSLEQIKEIINSGIEKVVLNTIAFENPKVLTDASVFVGSQSVVASVDVKKNLFGKYKVFVRNASINTGKDPVEYAKEMERVGAGEIFLNSIDRDGTFAGYDIELIKAVGHAVNIPVVAVGGASTVDDFLKAVQCGASAVAAGSMFVFKGTHRAVLISYPSQKELKEGLFLQLS